MIDTHAHLVDEKYLSADDVIQRALAAGVEKIVCASADLKTSALACSLVNNYDCVYATIGVHPENAAEWGEEAKQKLKKLAINKKVKAIGEIGLDYHYEFCSREQQKRAFIEQIDLAHALNLPVVIHTRDASGDTMEIIRNNLSKLKNKTCIHCYSMSLEILKEVISYGFKISLGGAITFKNARGLLDIVRACPLQNLMLETDSPYMAPEPYRGTINEPKNVVMVAKKIAELKNISLEEVISKTTQSAKEFFNI